MPKSVWVYVNNRHPVGHPDHMQIFADLDAANAWFEQHDPEGVAFQYPVQVGSPDDEAEAEPHILDAWQALHLIRETVETLGPPGALISEDQVLAQYGPEPIHEATAIVEALTALFAARQK
jgi:hypothetical protein